MSVAVVLITWKRWPRHSPIGGRTKKAVGATRIRRVVRVGQTVVALLALIHMAVVALGHVLPAIPAAHRVVYRVAIVAGLDGLTRPSVVLVHVSIAAHIRHAAGQTAGVQRVVQAVITELALVGHPIATVGLSTVGSAGIW